MSCAVLLLSYITCEEFLSQDPDCLYSFRPWGVAVVSVVPA